MSVREKHPITDNELTPKQEAFCVNYVANGCNATSAAKSAGYEEGTAKQMGYENLTKPYLLKRINEIRKQLNLSGIVSAEWVVSKLKDNAESCLQDVPVLDGDGEPIGEYKRDSSGANKALELIGKTMGMFVDKVDTTNLNGNLVLSDVEQAREFVKTIHEKYKNGENDTVNTQSTP